jgi:hypothetical protein
MEPVTTFFGLEILVAVGWEVCGASNFAREFH